MCAQPVDALLDDAVRLAHLLDAHQVAVVAVAVLAHRDVEVHVRIGGVGLFLAQVPRNAGAADHRTRETQAQRPLRTHDADADGALLPDAIVREQRLVLVNEPREAVREVLEEVEQRAAAGLVQLLDGRLAVPLGAGLAVDAARAVIGRVQARSRDRLVAVHQVFALAEAVQEHAHGADIKRVRAEPHQVVQDARDLIEQRADVLRTDRCLDAEQLLDGAHVAVLVAHHGHVVQPVHVADTLVERLGLGELLGAAVQQPDVRVGAVDDLAVHLEHQASV